MLHFCLLAPAESSIPLCWQWIQLSVLEPRPTRHERPTKMQNKYWHFCLQAPKKRIVWMEARKHLTYFSQTSDLLFVLQDLCFLLRQKSHKLTSSWSVVWNFNSKTHHFWDYLVCVSAVSGFCNTSSDVFLLYSEEEHVIWRPGRCEDQSSLNNIWPHFCAHLNWISSKSWLVSVSRAS